MNKNQFLKELQSISDRLSHLENDKKAAQNFDKMKERLEHGMPLYEDEKAAQNFDKMKERLEHGIPIYEDEKAAFNAKKQADELDFINDAIKLAQENPHLASRTVPWTRIIRL